MPLRKRSSEKQAKNLTSEVTPVAPTKKDFTDTELQDLRTAFGLLDRDRDGRVTVHELQFMLRNIGIEFSDEVIYELISGASKSDSSTAFGSLDRDLNFFHIFGGDGLIDETEFLLWVRRIQSLREDEEVVDKEDDVTKDLIAAFRVFDRDGNGYITKDELKTAMEIIGETVTDVQLDEMLTIADIDKDGKINYEEFARLLL